MFVPKILTFLAGSGLAVMLAYPCAGDVVYSNFGPGLTYDTSKAWGVQGAAYVGGPTLAVQFTPAFQATFSDAILALGFGFGATNAFSIYLETDVGGSPGAILESMILTGLPHYPSSSAMTATSVLHPVLFAATPYWLVGAASTPDSQADWFFNSTDDVSNGSNFAFSLAGPNGPWQLWSSGLITRPAFQIDGTPTSVDIITPEPKYLLLLAAMCIGAVIASRQANRRYNEQSNDLSKL